MKRPLVSVIVPNYNYARFLDERMQSILTQTYQNFEIIILDDCSKDNSRDVIEKYRGNPHVSCIVYNEVNSGSPFKQWNKGFIIAKGELIWIAEADDKCKNNQLEVLVQEFEKDDNLSLAFVRTVAFNDNGHEWIYYGNDVKNDGTIHLDGRAFVKKYMSSGSYVTNASSTLFKRSVISRVGDEYTTFKASGDVLFWIQVAITGNVTIVNKPLNYCRRHGTNVTESFSESGNGIQAIETKRIKDYLRDNNLISSWKYEIVCAGYIYYNILNHNFSQPEVKEQLLSLFSYNLFKKIVVFLLSLKIRISRLLKG
ncbi:MAG: glycosyltransferase family 2 protein [Muribaculaceae bacterium]